MNFYASHQYLDVVAGVYFKGRRTRIVDARIGDDVLRLLEVDKKHLVTTALFLDYHQPLLPTEMDGPVREHGYAEHVVRSVVEPAEWIPAEYVGVEIAPYVEWSKFPKWDDYKAFLLNRQRGIVKERERRARRLAEQVGEVVFGVDDQADDVFALALRWKSRQLRETGLRDYCSDPKTTECLHLLRKRGLLTCSTLRASGRLLTAWIGFIHDRVWSGWIFTYDPELAKYSVGHQLVTSMLQESHRLGHRELDFSEGAEGYKMQYATHGRLLGPIGRPPLRRRACSLARDVAARRAPSLLARARALKTAIADRWTNDPGDEHDERAPGGLRHGPTTGRAAASSDVAAEPQGERVG